MSIRSLIGSCDHSAPSMRPDARIHHIAWSLAFITVYLCLAFYRIDYQSLWVDEVFTTIAAAPERSFYDVGVWRLGSRPLYFTLLHLWAQFGTSEFVLRSFSAVIGCVGVVVFYLLALRIFERRTAVIATGLFATSPFLVWYSQEVRYITLLITSSLFAMYAYHRALSTSRIRGWLVYCCSLVLAIGAFLTNVLLVVIQALYLTFSRSRRKSMRTLIISQILVFILFAWWANEWQHSQLGGYWKRIYHELTLEKQELSSLPREQRFSRGGKRDFDLAAIPYTFFTLSAGFSLGPSVAELQTDRSLRALLPHAATLVPVTLLFGGLFVCGLIVLRQQTSNAILLGLWLAVPIATASTVSALTHAAFNVRYVAMVLPVYILVLTAGVVKFRSPVVQNGAMACLFAVNILSLSNYYFNPRYAREDARGAAQYLATKAGPQDIIVVVGSSVALRHYYDGAVPIRSWTPQETDVQPDAAIRLEKLAQNYDRLWLVETRRWEKDKTGQARKTAEKLYSAVNRHHFSGVEIYLFETLVRDKANSPRDRKTFSVSLAHPAGYFSGVSHSRSSGELMMLTEHAAM